MVKKFSGLRAEPEVLKRLRLLSVEIEAPMGDTLKRLLDLADAATLEQRTAYLLNDIDEEGRIVAEGPAAVDREHVDDILTKTRRKAALIEELKELSDDAK